VPIFQEKETVVPVENERKAVLKPSDPELLLHTLKREPNVQTVDITQGYISKSARIRHMVDHKTGEEQHVFTYKTRVAGSVVELEQSILIHDYHKLFLIAKPVIYKTRCKFKEGAFQWDIDFFKNTKSGVIYLALAEVEMPEFCSEVPEIHSLVADSFSRWVDSSDKRFQNRNLGNKNKVVKLLREI